MADRLDDFPEHDENAEHTFKPRQSEPEDFAPPKDENEEEGKHGPR